MRDSPRIVRISGYKTQAAIQTAILASLTKSLYQGNYTSSQFGKPKSLILIGHSFGSSTSNAALAEIPSLVDAAILTGFGLNGADKGIKLEGFVPRIARLQRPEKNFASFDLSYVTTADVFAAINMFFKAPFYDRRVAHFGEATKQPFSLFELLTVGPTPAPDYKGPVLVISGEFDFPTCAGYCPGALNIKGFRKFFPKVKALETYVQPNSGHVLNFAKNATGFYEAIFAFLDRHGF